MILTCFAGCHHHHSGHDLYGLELIYQAMASSDYLVLVEDDSYNPFRF